MSNWVRGKTLHNDQYTIIEVLGEGGFGITYLAKDETGRKVVIKTLNTKIQLHPGFSFNRFQQCFEDEAKRLQRCQYPNIVKFYNLIYEDNLCCIVMEYIEGDSLNELVMRQGVLQEAEALNYIQQIGQALSVAHSQGILHRDIKPENIIIRNNKPEAVLIDFGIAREFTPNRTNSHTEFRSEGYAPIEQYYPGHKPGPGEYTDVYALAATLYVLLTGYNIQRGYNSFHRLPPAPERANNLRTSQTDPLLAPNKINPNISKWVNQAILKGMEVEPRNRPQTVRKWLELLQPNPSISQSPTLPIPRIKYFSKAVNTNINNDIKLFFQGGLLFLFLFVGFIYANSPYLTFGQRSRSSQTPKPPKISDLPYQEPQSQTPTKTRNREVLKSPKIFVKTINIDYRYLQQLLASKRFEDADQETLRIMLLLAQREKQAWFEINNIKNFSCSDLRKIDQLWIKYSNGRFGFSVQKNKWANVGGQLGVYDVAIADRFANQVGWRIKDKLYDNLSYDLSAPSGHLPFKVTSRVWKFGVPYIAEKLVRCTISS